MGKSFYTFIIVRNATSRLHKIKLPVRALYLLGTVGVILLFVAVSLGFSYAKMAFKAADYDKLEAENTDLKVQKKNLEVATLKLGEKITNLESVSEKIQNLIENDPITGRGKLNRPAIGGSKIDYPTSALLGVTKPDVELMKDRTSEVEEHFSTFEEIVRQRATMWRMTPNVWPVKGTITSHYGERLDPFSGDAENHLGLDISALYGASVRAPADGRVIYAQRMAAYGNLLIIDHGNGLTTRYGHLSRFIAGVGQKVKRNEVVALVGNTGRTTAPHLHYEVRLGDRPRNPRDYLPKG